MNKYTVHIKVYKTVTKVKAQTKILPKQKRFYTPHFIIFQSKLLFRHSFMAIWDQNSPLSAGNISLSMSDNYNLIIAVR